MGLKKHLARQNGKLAHYAHCEEKVHQWYNSEVEKDTNITTHLIRSKMLEEMTKSHPDDLKTFKASYGWMRRFLNRYDLVKRKITSTGRGDPKASAEEIKEYLGEAYSFGKQFSLDQIINFDQASFYMEMVGNYTIRNRGINLE
jgi:hypothetical protein